MTIKPKPGNQPDANDMSEPLANDGEGSSVGSSPPNLDDAEEEAAKLGDFA